MKLTYAALKAKKPCKSQLKIYMENFPDNLEIRKADLLKAAELNLNLGWFAANFLKATAWEAYYKATAPAFLAYLKAIAPAREAYENALVPAWKAYVKATMLALWDIVK